MKNKVVIIFVSVLAIIFYILFGVYLSNQEWISNSTDLQRMIYFQGAFSAVSLIFLLWHICLIYSYWSQILHIFFKRKDKDPT